jgi:hypothetical protein
VAAAATSTIYNHHLQLRPPQERIFFDGHRHKVVVAGSRFGKTFLALNFLIDSAIKFPRSRGWYISPTRVMSKDIAWTDLKMLVGVQPEDDSGDYDENAPLVHSIHEGELRVMLKNGSIIQLMTAQDPERLRGRALKAVVFDEFGDMDGPRVWTAIRPRIGDKKLRLIYGELGRTLFIGTPKGFNHFKDLFDDVRAKVRGADWRAWRFTSVEGGNIDKSEIEKAKMELSARDWRQEYEATFESIEGRVYHSFLRDSYSVTVGGSVVFNHGNLDESVHDPGGTILLGCDFNVQPMCWTLSSKMVMERPFRFGPQNPKGVQYELHTWKEYKMENCNTATMIDAIRADFPGRHLVAHPDPHVGRHTTSANVGETDHTILASKGVAVFPPRMGTNSDKFNTANGLLCNSMGHRRALINPSSCPHLVKSLDSLCYIEGSNLPDKSKGFDHMSDAYSYSVLGVFPIVVDTVSMSTVSI